MHKWLNMINLVIEDQKAREYIRKMKEQKSHETSIIAFHAIDVQKEQNKLMR